MITEAEYYNMTDAQLDKWVHDTFGVEFGIRITRGEIHAARIASHRDANTVMAVAEKMIADGWSCTSNLSNWCSFDRNLSKDWRKAEIHGVNAKEFHDAVYLAAGRAKGEVE